MCGPGTEVTGYNKTEGTCGTVIDGALIVSTCGPGTGVPGHNKRECPCGTVVDGAPPTSWYFSLVRVLLGGPVECASSSSYCGKIQNGPGLWLDLLRHTQLATPGVHNFGRESSDQVKGHAMAPCCLR